MTTRLRRTESEIQQEREKALWKAKVLKEHYETSELAEQVIEAWKKTRKKSEEIHEECDKVVQVWKDYNQRLNEAFDRLDDRVEAHKQFEAELREKKWYAQASMKKEFKNLNKTMDPVEFRKITASD